LPIWRKLRLCWSIGAPTSTASRTASWDAEIIDRLARDLHVAVFAAVWQRASEHAAGPHQSTANGYAPAIALVADGVTDDSDRAVAELDADTPALLEVFQRGVGRGSLRPVTAPDDQETAIVPDETTHEMALDGAVLNGTARTLSDTERAVLGDVPAAQVLTFFNRYTRDHLGEAIRTVRFRAGRIDAVWGVELADGREVVIKAHRQPVDVQAVAAATDAKALLVAAGYPCPRPYSGPDEVEGQVLVAETLLSNGAAPDGLDPVIRRLLADGLARHIDLLRQDDTLAGRAGTGPSWCQYQHGPWPTPHDPIVDFTTCPPGYEWLDAYARRASEQVLTYRSQDVVVGHADWYAGNCAVTGGELVGTFDWELVADTEAVIAGFAASCYASSSSAGGGLSTPEETLAFLQDYELARGIPFDGAEQRAAAAAAAWIVAFNARWETAMRPGLEDGATTALVRRRDEDYLALTW